MHLKNWLILLLLVSLSLACSMLNPTRPERLPDTKENTPATTPNVIVPVETDEETPEFFPLLATPMAQNPAAGICGGFEGEWITVTINPDIPNPRCVIIQADQKLEVVNNRGEIIHVKIGQMEADLEDGQSYRFDVPFGEYLLPGGVHAIDVQPCCGGVLWFQEGE